ncbi:hypothetical protein DEO23_00045 [Brachybacterium endophyticum]|uniref:F420-dependent oxidoreductase n=1 Tax=Brachybacterium endophyticum TaxID=2182385 RepID=A0A2U2RMJ2_9MICO|nr:Pr6Pr family membrane protein [Brachybacterium endophyticum]PWH07097.1 hypothetical protein DEO23_00045 [Brachybacterium endophyticum]
MPEFASPPAQDSSAAPDPASPANGPSADRPAIGAVQRLSWGLVAACAAFGMCGSLVLSLGDSLDGSTGVGLGPTLVRYVSFFTILTNLAVLIAATSFLLGGRPGPVLRVLTLNAVTGIVITGVVHWFLLRPISETPPGVPALVDTVQHIVVPLLTAVVWIVVGPRGHVRGRTVLGSLLFPLAYLVWTLAHGTATGWYPYPFIDVAVVGYADALHAGIVILVIMEILACGCWLRERLTPAGRLA